MEYFLGEGGRNFQIVMHIYVQIKQKEGIWVGTKPL
jgi:hypothetical protein